MCIGWRRLSTESAGDGEKRRRLTGLLVYLGCIKACELSNSIFQSSTDVKNKSSPGKSVMKILCRNVYSF